MGMAELIDKWEVVGKLITLQNNYTFFKNEWDAERLYREIAKLEISVGKTPGLDLVRCKDCAVPHNKWLGCPKLRGLVPPPDFYCAFGERREGE